MSELVLENTNELPDNWILTDIESVCHDPQYGFTTSAKSGGDVKFLRTTDITSGQINWDTVPYCKKNPEDVEKYLLKNNDVVISRAGSIGYSYLVESPPKAVFASYLIRFNAIMNSKFFSYFLQSPYYWKAISETKIGVAVQNVNATKLKQILIPLPPLNEQKRIVKKIEKSFSELDHNLNKLKKIKQLLSQYVKSTLQSAFDGNLVDVKYYKKNTDFNKLLDLIENERETIFLKTFFDNNESKIKPKYSPPRKYAKENIPISTKKWNVVSLETVCSFVQGGSTPLRTDSDNFSEDGFPLIKVENILKNGIVFLKNNQLRITKKPHNKMWKSKVYPNDILMNIVGPPLGKIGIVPKNFPESNINQAIVLMRTVPSYMNKFLLFCLQSPQYYDYQLKLSTGVRQENIRKSSVGEIPIPLLPLNAQKEIVLKIEQRLSKVENILEIIHPIQKNLELMRSSILKQAFEGKLVPQDPNDEPAEILLQKIKAEKEQLIQKQKASRSKKNVK